MIYEPEKTEDLLMRFFEGQTSGEEEQTLYRFFDSDDLPAHLACYKPVFKYFETGLAKETAAQSAAAESRKAPRPAVKWRQMWAGLAAAVATGCIVILSHRQTDSFEPYEGSYIIRGGIRITDMELIRPELEKTFREAFEQQANMERLIREPADPDDVIERYRRTIEQQQQNAVLGGFADPCAREEARKLLTADYHNF
ncbi:MAG: hypothetical protein LBF85_09255 [Tannerella sp.]|jgi:hypothetical protein|nr:hypothetical protein [Tannerella sp.]